MPSTSSIKSFYGGKISAANNPDGGATFSITLPVGADRILGAG